MSTPTIEEARDIIAGVVADFFLNDDEAELFLVGADSDHPIPGVTWDDTPARRPDEVDDDGAVLPWARVTIRHATGAQGSPAGASGTARYDNAGTMIIQVFMPQGKGLRDHDPLVELLVKHLRQARPAGGVWFRNVRLQEVGNTRIAEGRSSGPWYQSNVVADFRYSQVQ